MNPETLIPNSNDPFASRPTGGSGRPGGLLVVFLIVLGLGTLGFGALTVIFATKANTATKTLESQKAAAAAKARDDQKAADDEANIHANNSPFRAYTAPQAYGSFVISFPKTWSSSVDEESRGTQVSLVLNPDFIRRAEGQDARVATRVTFQDTPRDRFLAQYTSLLKRGTMKQTDMQISGQPALSLTGAFPDRKTTRQVVVPIRDRVLVFTTENDQYSTEFNQILAQAKVNP